MPNQVAITGIGVFSPIGNSVPQLLDSLQKGKSGITAIKDLQLQHPSELLSEKIKAFLEKAHHTLSAQPQFQNASFSNLFDNLHRYLNEQYFVKVRSLNVRCIGMVKNFTPTDILQPKDIKKTDRFQHLALAASEMAKQDAGLTPWIYNHYPAEKIAVVAGSSMGGMLSWEETYWQYLTQGLKGVRPHFMLKQPVDTAAGEISRHQGTNGPIECPVAACATGALVVGRAYQLIKQELVDVAIATASEASLSHLGLGGFEALKALVTKDYGDPTKASRPFDKDRSGFVMAEGGVSLILEDLEKARKRGAPGR